MRLDAISRFHWIIAGLLLRIGMLVWGTIQDSTSAVPYTDIDYHVFTSATRHLLYSCPLDSVISASPQEEYRDLADPPEARGSCAQGFIAAFSRFVLQTEPRLGNVEAYSLHDKDEEGGKAKREMHLLTAQTFSLTRPVFRLIAGLGNPYKRDTYRYTPLLALLLTPGEYIGSPWGSALFGKAIFVLADLIIALLIWDIMDLRRTRKASANEKDDSWLAGTIWLLNPFTAQISTRGSSESILGVLVLGFLDATLRSYPEKHAKPVTEVEVSAKEVILKDESIAEDESIIVEQSVVVEMEDGSKWNNTALLAPFLLALSIHWKLYPVVYAAALVPHLIQSESIRGLFRYGGIAVYSLLGITTFVYAIWGPPFLNETLFYHLSRSDHRHNFSPFFLPSYLYSTLSTTPESWPRILSALYSMQSQLAFLPQLAITAYLGFAMGAKDLVAALTFQTMAFVTYNKVCTSQYYMWIIWFLPILAPRLHFSNGSRDVAKLVAVWVVAQAIWLSQAYLLEFKAMDTYLRVWVASLLLLFTHAWLLVKLVQAWAEGEQRRSLGKSKSQ
jgi:phosphatidylinositol glycan class M